MSERDFPPTHPNASYGAPVLLPPLESNLATYLYSPLFPPRIASTRALVRFDAARRKRHPRDLPLVNINPLDRVIRD